MVSFKNFVQSSTTGSGQSNLTEAYSKADRYDTKTAGKGYSGIDFDFITAAGKVVKKINSTYERYSDSRVSRWREWPGSKEAISLFIWAEVPFDKEEFERTGDGEVPYIWIKDSEQMELTIEKLTKKINSMGSSTKVDYIRYDNNNNYGNTLDKGYIKCVFFVSDSF